MKQTILKLLLFINSILLIAYMGLTAHADFHLNTRGVIPLFLSSLLLIDVTYVSSCNIRENKTISLFCGLFSSLLTGEKRLRDYYDSATKCN